MRGRGREEYCRNQKQDDEGVPAIHLDYMFMGEENEDKTLAVLVARERYTKATFATAVQRKGIDQWVPKRLLAWMREIGLEHNDVVAKSENEPALLTLIDAWLRQRAAKVGRR